MGISDLTPFLKKHAPTGIITGVPLTPAGIGGKGGTPVAAIGIDGTAVACRFAHGALSSGRDLEEMEEGPERDELLVERVSSKLAELVNYLGGPGRPCGFSSVIVAFDGATPPGKLVVKERAKRKRENKAVADGLTKRRRIAEARLAAISPPLPHPAAVPVPVPDKEEEKEPRQQHIPPPLPGDDDDKEGEVETPRRQQSRAKREDDGDDDDAAILELLMTAAEHGTAVRRTLAPSRAQCVAIAAALVASVGNGKEGAPWLTVRVADYEADELLLQLARAGEIGAILGDDGDFVAGMPPGTFLVRDVWDGFYDHLRHSSSRGKRREGETTAGGTCTVYDKTAILAALGDMHPRTFVDMCILFGCDFCPRIPLVGPATVYAGFKALMKEGRRLSSPPAAEDFLAREVFELVPSSSPSPSSSPTLKVVRKRRWPAAAWGDSDARAIEYAEQFIQARVSLLGGAGGLPSSPSPLSPLVFE